MTSIVIPNTFLPATTISSTAMNANFTTVAAAFAASLGLAGADTMLAGLRAADGSAALPGYTFGSDLNTGMYSKAADQIGFSTAGTLRAFIDAAGKGWFSGALDVATTLDVAGAQTVGGALTIAANLNMSSTASRLVLAEQLAQQGAGFGGISGIASASTTDIGTLPSHYVNITGSTTINSFGNSASGNCPVYLIRIASGLTINNTANMFLPNGVALTLGGNDHLLMRFQGASIWQCIAVFRDQTGQPAVQRFLSGSGTYTPGVGTRYIRGRIVGAGAGGSAAAANAGSAGGGSSFGGWTAGGGQASTIASGTGGAGGTGGANGTGTLINRANGMPGGTAFVSGSAISGHGGSSPFGSGGSSKSGNNNGENGTGQGSGGSGGTSGANGGPGGGAGECVEFFMTALQIGASQSYSVGAAGTGGTAGLAPGGNGTPGGVFIEEFYT